MNRSRLTRRRALRVIAIAAAMAPLPWADPTAPAAHEWTGPAFGTRARLVLYHPDKATAQRALADCVAEIDRLENEFSLFRPRSALAVLNRDGRLDAPSLDMRRLFSVACHFGTLSAGVFDISIQPLWELYATHFERAGLAGGGPDPSAVAAARALVDYRRIDVGARRIAFARRGMAVTLNGIAQGYVTDRVADLLRDRGFGHVLVDIGELRALDGRGDGSPWHVALRHPAARDLALDLTNQAIATSAGQGSRFTVDGLYNHLIDPRSGRSPDPARAVSVIAPDATTADALSTALCIMPDVRAAAILKATGAERAVVSAPDGRVTVLSA